MFVYVGTEKPQCKVANNVHIFKHTHFIAAKLLPKSALKYGFKQVFKGRLLISDINECLEGTAKCNQYCHNSVGSYFCSCARGFKLGSDKHTCLGKKLFTSYVLNVLNTNAETLWEHELSFSQTFKIVSTARY